MLAAETNNKIPKNNGVIKATLRSQQSEERIDECIKEIKSHYPKFKENKGFYYFGEWGNRCNWIAGKELPGNSQGTAGDGADKIRIDKNRLDKIIKEYIKIRRLDAQIKEFPAMEGEIYRTQGKAVKRLYSVLKEDADLVCRAIYKAGEYFNQRGLDWNLYTILKHLDKGLDNSKEMLNRLGFTYADLCKKV
jgi:hypothetical protein